jgi:crossover junction endodeoxyribonuclease RuvC
MILALDPGIHGALALAAIGPSIRHITVADFPTLRVGTSTRDTRVDLDLPALQKLISDHALFATHIFIERVGAMPKQGLASTFRFGYAAGIVHALVLGMKTPIFFVPPQIWRRAVGVTGTGKDACRARAQELFPKSADVFTRVRDQHRADAALIAAYGSRFVLGAK